MIGELERELGWDKHGPRVSAPAWNPAWAPVWDDSDEWYVVAWGNLTKALEQGSRLNEGERKLLLLLLSRVMASKEARRKLGFKVSATRTAQRNLAVARMYAALKAQRKSRAKIESTVFEAFPGLGADSLRHITESSYLMAKARTHNFAAYLLERNPEATKKTRDLMIISGGEAPPKEKRKRSGGKT